MKRLLVVLLALAALALAAGGGFVAFRTFGLPGLKPASTTAAAPAPESGKADSVSRPAGAQSWADASAAAPGTGSVPSDTQAGGAAAAGSPSTTEQAAAAGSTAPAAEPAAGAAATAASGAEAGNPASQGAAAGSRTEVGAHTGAAVAAGQATPGPEARKSGEAPDPQLVRVVRLYEGMKPKEAAMVIARLEPALGTAIISGMRDRQAAKVLGLLPPDKAADITARLAGMRAGASTGPSVEAPRAGAPARAATGKRR